MELILPILVGQNNATDRTMIPQNTSPITQHEGAQRPIIKFISLTSRGMLAISHVFIFHIEEEKGSSEVHISGFTVMC